MLLSELDYALSLKIGDPVLQNDDGKNFHKDVRVKYIERAYARMLRILPKLMKEHCPTFANNKLTTYVEFDDSYASYGYSSEELALFKGGNEIYFREYLSKRELPFKKIHQLRVTVTKIIGEQENYYNFATYIDPDKFMNVQYAQSDLYTPSPRNTFYTILNERVHLLPLFEKFRVDLPGAVGGIYTDGTMGYYAKDEYKYTNIEALFTQDAPVLNVSDLESYDLKISRDYVDLLIVMAAYEAMQDIARQDKAQIYANDITGQLNILTGYAQSERSEQGVS